MSSDTQLSESNKHKAKPNPKDTICTQLVATPSGLCYSAQSLEWRFRRLEALQITTELNSKIMNALDKVMFSNGPSDPEFHVHVGFVLAHQYDLNNMNILIDQNYLNNADQFRAGWAIAAGIYKYRKRYITNYIIVSYNDDGCLRRITLHGVGTSFGIVNAVSPTHPTLDFVEFDRFTINYVETEPGVFKVNGLTQITESEFPLPDGAHVVSSPYSTLGAYIPTL